MKTSDFDYVLPQELIAQTPVELRDHSRLFVLKRASDTWEHRRFFELLDYLEKGDLLVLNDSRVLPARLRGRRASTGGRVEVLLLRSLGDRVWETLVRPGRRIRVGSTVEFVAEGTQGCETVTGEIIGAGDDGTRMVRFSNEAALDELGQVPLPPYIHAPLSDPERYQTVYSKEKGSVAAPTAGLHFTRELLDKVREKGVETAFVTLHVGPGTFRPVAEEDPARHKIHAEYAVLGEDTARQLNRARTQGRRIVAVGTTAVRVLEEAALRSAGNELAPFADWNRLLILPGHRFQMVDALITNFHLPRSTLLMLVSAFAGHDPILSAYAEAVRQRYRFYSFGDAMLIL